MGKSSKCPNAVMRIKAKKCSLGAGYGGTVILSTKFKASLGQPGRNKILPVTLRVHCLL